MEHRRVLDLTRARHCMPMESLRLHRCQPAPVEVFRMLSDALRPSRITHGTVPVLALARLRLLVSISAICLRIPH